MKLVRPPPGVSLPNHSMMSISVPDWAGFGEPLRYFGCIHSDACCPWSGWNLIRAATTPYVMVCVAWVPMLALRRYLNLPKIFCLPGFFGLQSALRFLSMSTLSWAVPLLILTALGSPFEHSRLASFW